MLTLKQKNQANDIMDHYLRTIDPETISPDDPNHIAKLQESVIYRNSHYFFVAKTPFMAEAKAWRTESFSPDGVGIFKKQISSFRTGLVFIPGRCVLGYHEATLGTLNSQIIYCDTDGLPIWEKKAITGWEKYVEVIDFQRWKGEKLRIAIQSNTSLITKYPRFQYGILGWPTLIWIKKPTFSIPTFTIESRKSSMWIWKLLRLANRCRNNPAKG